MQVVSGVHRLKPMANGSKRLALEGMMYSVHQTTRPVPKQGATGRPSLSIPGDRVLDHQVTPPGCPILREGKGATVTV